MSELRIDTWNLPVAPLGAENPLPPLSKPTLQPVLSGKPDGDPQAGYLPDFLPYAVQDGYSRDRQPTALKVAVLENQFLRATFLLDYGGRLWSLIHKPTGRELLFVNPMLQPGNLAIRNAWFSGGVEWNMGLIGHTPFTCEPLFVARLESPDGTPILRMYEWERIRQAAYQIDAYLPDGSTMLYVRCRLVNPFDHEIPMYWWSNMAVPERADVRVITPAPDAYQFALSISDLRIVDMPVVEGTDVTYSTNGTRAADYFFRIPEKQRPWITALDSEGKGLVQVSTDALRGRKLFLWGTGSGGKRWQEWLNGTGNTYLEIQAGLAPTQLQYATLQPREEVQWLEAYGLMQADPRIVHGADWKAAQADVESRIEQVLPRTDFDAELRRGDLWKNTPPAEIIQRGSCWGALEAARRQSAAEHPFAGNGLDFDGAFTTTQQPWLQLLQTGNFPDNPSDVPVAGIITQPEWHQMLEAAVKHNAATNWEAWLHLGVMRLHTGDETGARQAWQTSLQHKRTAWALRNLAVLAQRQGDTTGAANLYHEAYNLRPNLLPLLVETARALIEAGRASDFLHLLEQSNATIRHHGRICLLEVQAGLAIGDLERVGQLFDRGFEIADYREGDEILTELWVRYHVERISRAENIPADQNLLRRVHREHPIPSVFDFRMKIPAIE